MDSLQLEQIIARIEQAFGEELPLFSEPLEECDLALLRRVLGEDSFQVYLQDQHNRQLIRDYLTNAVVLGIIPAERLTAFAERLATEAGRSALSLNMLMHSVEDAEYLASSDEEEELKPLEPGPESPPHIKLVPN